MSTVKRETGDIMESVDVRQAVPSAVLAAATEFEHLQHRLARHFATQQVANNMAAYVKGLLARVERKNCWQLAEEAGKAAPYDFHYVLGRAHWDEDDVRDELMLYVGESLGWRNGTLAIDETGFLKKGKKSAGVARMYSGTAGRIENCQIGVFLSYHTSRGHALVDRELYLPKEWTEAPSRCREAGVPDDRPFMTKPEIARTMLRRAYVEGFRPAWVTGDEVYGASGDLRRDLEKRGQAYVLAVASNVCVNEGGATKRVDAIMSAVREDAFETHSCGNGSKGPRLYDWARVELMHSPHGRLHRWVLCRWNRSTGERAYYFVAASAQTSLAQMARAAGDRWPIEECFETDKTEVGLKDYEVRTYRGWYRHMTMALAASAFLVKLRVAANQERETSDPKAQKEPSMEAFRLRQKRACASASRKSGDSWRH
jgi:SRSO17 transposase